ncbi:cell division protein FtsQ/DivIB [Aquimarina agarivorans]|uniref:cell division protein FtsQ/DivIB n=1 Tax=Aquimarina agarivorans TaxID=980584 RepID=UPI000248FCEB|nr:hypothetical protein [Aquimarina agarivorans]
MKKIKYPIGIVVALIVLVGLFVFAKERNYQRKLVQDKVEFIGDQRLFLSEDFVNKLLIQKAKNDSIPTKEVLVLNEREQLIENEIYVDNAEVYVAVNGRISAQVAQRVPVARIYGSEPKYIDTSGKLMPLSQNNSVRVPLVYYFAPKHKNDLLVLLEKIKEDYFLEKSVVGINCLSDNNYSLRVRNHDFSVRIGDISNLDLKFKNLKAFYAKAQKDKLFEMYALVDLGITNQVICTKI